MSWSWRRWEVTAGIVVFVPKAILGIKLKHLRLCGLHTSIYLCAFMHMLNLLSRSGGNPICITNSTKHSPSWEPNRFQASHEIPRIIWNANVHHRIHNSLYPASILSQIDPVHAPPPHSSNIHFNIILPSRPGSSKCFPSLRFPHQNPVCIMFILPRQHKKRICL